MSVPVWALPCLSQEFEQGPRIEARPGGKVAIAYDYELDGGGYAWEELVFDGVAAFAFTAAPHCTPEQIEAYDELHLVDSSWVIQLFEPPDSLRHHRIYFDDFGCYDMLAEGFTPPSRRRGDEGSGSQSVRGQEAGEAAETEGDPLS
ncbi:MAG TPA: hypothetical protein VFU19_19140 [Iamia sp.]|nr:hypothetical protein [Iamia sp.]